MATGEDIADLLAARLADMAILKADIVIADMLGNSCFMGFDDDDMPTHAIKKTGAYYITGSMEHY